MTGGRVIGDESPPPVTIGSLTVVPSYVMIEVMIPIVTPETDGVLLLISLLVERTDVEDSAAEDGAAEDDTAEDGVEDGSPVIILLLALVGKLTFDVKLDEKGDVG